MSPNSGTTSSRLRSFTAAAEKLHTTQAAISARIATLETDFGVKLFERDKRTVTLTNSGEELLKHAEELLGISARMREAVSDRAAYGGFIAVGVIEAIVDTWLPELLASLRQQFPTVERRQDGRLRVTKCYDAACRPCVKRSVLPSGS